MGINDRFFIDSLISEDLPEAKEAEMTIPEYMMKGLETFGFSEDEILLLNYYRNKYSSLLSLLGSLDELGIPEIIYYQAAVEMDYKSKRSNFTDLYKAAYDFIFASIMADDDDELRQKQLFAYAVITGLEAFNKVDLDSLDFSKEGESEKLFDYSKIDFEQIETFVSLSYSFSTVSDFEDLGLLYQYLCYHETLKKLISEEEWSDLHSGIPCGLGLLSAYMVHLSDNKESDVKVHINQVRLICNLICNFATDEQEQEKQ